MKFLVISLLAIFMSGCSLSGPFERGTEVPADAPAAEKPGESIEKKPQETAPDTEPDPEPVVSPEEIYRLQVEPLIAADCMMCHRSKIQSYSDARERIVPGAPDSSSFLLKAIGHRHRKIWSEDSDAAASVIEWIMAEDHS